MRCHDDIRAELRGKTHERSGLHSICSPEVNVSKFLVNVLNGPSVARQNVHPGSRLLTVLSKYTLNDDRSRAPGEIGLSLPPLGGSHHCYPPWTKWCKSCDTLLRPL
jgi:hypothetical protein